MEWTTGAYAIGCSGEGLVFVVEVAKGGIGVGRLAFALIDRQLIGLPNELSDSARIIDNKLNETNIAGE
jgi:hypothetical protein